MNLEDQVRHQLRKVGHANNTEVSYGIGFGFSSKADFDGQEGWDYAAASRHKRDLRPQVLDVLTAKE